MNILLQTTTDTNEVVQQLQQVMPVEDTTSGLSLSVILFIVALIVLGIAFFLTFIYQKKQRNIFETTQIVDPKNPRVTFAGDSGDFYDSRIKGEIRVKDGKIYTTLDDGTQLRAIDSDDWEVVKDTSVWKGETRIICRVDANNRIQKWHAPDFIKVFLRATETEKRIMKKQALDEFKDNVELLERINSSANTKEIRSSLDSLIKENR